MFCSNLMNKAFSFSNAFKIVNVKNMRFSTFKQSFYSGSIIFSKRVVKLKPRNGMNYFSKKAYEESSKSSIYKEMLNNRKKQAQSSVLLELKNKEDIHCAVASCEKFGVIKKAYSYKGISENIFVLLEFEDKASVHNMLLSSSYKNISDVFPVFSRIIGYSNNFEQNHIKPSVEIEEDNPGSTPLAQGTVSDLIGNVYMNEKLTDLNIRLRFFFCCIVKELLKGPFPFCDAIPFGSTVNGVGRHGCDLDMMVRLYPEQINSSDLYFVNKTCVGDIQNLQRKVVYCVGDMLRTFSPGVTSVQKILNARVPIIKLDHRILGMKVDISVNNIHPILMSELLHFWGEIDVRIRPLIYAVKKWAREANVTYETPGTWITNFSLTLLVIFFLQNRPIPIIPPMNESVRIIGEEFSEDYGVEFLVPVSELQAKASLNKESLAALLKEFFSFLGSHPFENKVISLFLGGAKEEKTDSPLWVQYPFDERLNVSKNVSNHELFDMCEKARVSKKYLETNMKSKHLQSRNLTVIFGIPNICKLGQNKANRIDVSSILGESMSKKSNRQRAL